MHARSCWYASNRISSCRATQNDTGLCATLTPHCKAKAQCNFASLCDQKPFEQRRRLHIPHNMSRFLDPGNKACECIFFSASRRMNNAFWGTMHAGAALQMAARVDLCNKQCCGLSPFLVACCLFFRFVFSFPIAVGLRWEERGARSGLHSRWHRLLYFVVRVCCLSVYRWKRIEWEWRRS